MKELVTAMVFSNCGDLGYRTIEALPVRFLSISYKNCCMLFGYTRFRSFCPILFKPFTFWLRENQNFRFLIYIYIYCLIELSNYFVTIIINLSFGFYLFIYFYKNTKALLRRREIQYILSQNGFKHNRILFYSSYKMRNTFTYWAKICAERFSCRLTWQNCTLLKSHIF